MAIFCSSIGKLGRPGGGTDRRSSFWFHPRYQGAENSGCRQESGSRVEPRACRVGAERLRLSRGDSRRLRRHLFLECRQKWDRAGSAERGRGRYACSRTQSEIPNYQLTVSLAEAQTVTDGRRISRRSRSKSIRSGKFCLVEGLDDIGLTLATCRRGAGHV